MREMDFAMRMAGSVCPPVSAPIARAEDVARSAWLSALCPVPNTCMMFGVLRIHDDVIERCIHRPFRGEGQTRPVLSPGFSEDENHAGARSQEDSIRIACGSYVMLRASPLSGPLTAH